MDSNQQFKAAFFSKMASYGLDPDQVDGAASLAILVDDAYSNKEAIDFSTLALLGLVGTPVAAGLTGGYMAARAGDDPLAVDRLKHKEILNELNTQTDAIRRQSKMRHSHQMPTMAVPSPMRT